jgi:putative ABC transport system permease protein
MALFNRDSLFRILVQVTTPEAMSRVRQRVEDTIKLRHQNELDVTVVTQDALLATFDRIFTALTMTLAGIASVSLLVAGVLVMNVMLVAVTQRTSEVGLLKAIGATQRQITALFLAEAILLSLAGAAAGIIVGNIANWVVRQIYPALPLGTPLWAYALAIVVALLSGIGFGLMPARRAAKLDPVVALAGKR